MSHFEGILVETLTTGSVADAIGRQKTLFYGQIIATIFFLLQLAVKDVIGLAVIRFCLGPLYHSRTNYSNHYSWNTRKVLCSK